MLETEVGDDPVAEVARWVADADAADLAEPRAMQLATATPDGRPTVRTVLLRDLDDRGFFFVTNHESTKGRQLAANPACALTIVWTSLLRQVNVVGVAERAGEEDTERYWRGRPRGSRIAAWASPQSRVLADRAALEQAFREAEERFAGTDEIPVPPFWGGWWVVPSSIELWCGRPNRLHDRLRWRRSSPTAPWVRERLAP